MESTTELADESDSESRTEAVRETLAESAAGSTGGKTVIPFCTSSSSGLGESGELLAAMAGTGNWLEGERFSSGVSQETVQSWVEGLGL